MIGWTKTQEFVDKIRYEISCKKGQAILKNVEYYDKACSDYQGLRWKQSEKGLHWDFSARFNQLIGTNKFSIKKTNKVKIKPFSLDTAQIKFYIQTLGRVYKVVWEPKSNKIFSTW